MDAYVWRTEREMEQAAWLAWHFLVPHMRKGSRLKPADLLHGDGEARAAVKPVTKEEARRELEALRRDMGDL